MKTVAANGTVDTCTLCTADGVHIKYHSDISRINEWHSYVLKLSHRINTIKFFIWLMATWGGSTSRTTRCSCYP